MINDIAPVLILLAGALLILGGTRLARLAKLPEAFGTGAALWLIAIGVGLFVANWRPWEVGSAWGDRLLTYARLVGLTGMLFLAGTSFQGDEIRKRTMLWFGLFGASLFMAATLLLKFFSNQHTGPAALIAATLVASSVWYPAQLRWFEKREKGSHTVDWLVGAVILSTLAMLAVYFFDILGGYGRARPNVSVYVLVTLYELVKLAVLFGFAYFISTRFLARAEGRISVIRTTIGFVLMATLLFALIALTTSQLGALAWAFLAGALWRRTKVGREFSESPKPLASATLLSFVFVSLLLQSHGRHLSRPAVLLVVIMTAIGLKIVFAWLVLKAGRMAKTRRARLAVTTALPGEIAILFLGFGMTRWAIDAPVYFGILGYGILSSLLVPIIWHLATQERTIAVGARRDVMKSKMKTVLCLIVCAGILSFSSSTGSAQQSPGGTAGQEVRLGSGMSVLAPGLMEIGAKTNLFLVLADKIPVTAEQRKKLEDLVFGIQMYSVQKETDLDVADAELKRLLTRGNIDLAAVRAKMKEIEGIRGDADMKKIETLLTAISLLTHEQHTRSFYWPANLKNQVNRVSRFINEFAGQR